MPCCSSDTVSCEWVDRGANPSTSLVTPVVADLWDVNVSFSFSTFLLTCSLPFMTWKVGFLLLYKACQFLNFCYILVTDFTFAFSYSYMIFLPCQWKKRTRLRFVDSVQMNEEFCVQEFVLAYKWNHWFRQMKMLTSYWEREIWCTYREPLITVKGQQVIDGEVMSALV